MAADRAAVLAWCLALAVGRGTDGFAWCQTNAKTGCVGRATEFIVGNEYFFNATRRLGIKAGLDSVQPLSFRQVQPVLADWDGDGDLDLALVQPGESIRFFEHQEEFLVELVDSPFAGRTAECRVDLQSGFSMADWDGDGLLDLVAASILSPGAVICRQGPQGQFQEINDQPFTEIGSFQAISMLDWDQDGDFDLLIMKDHQLLLLEQDELGAIQQIFPLKGPIWHFSAVNRDGVMDLLVSSFPDGNAKYFRHGDLQEMHGDYNPFNQMISASNEATFALNDWNADGEMDFLLITAGNIKHYHQQPLQFLEATENLLHGIPSTDALAFQDMNADGILDVILMNADDRIRSFERRGAHLVELSDPFRHARLSQVPEKMLLIADVDADGDLDIVRSHVQDGGISYYQQENGHFRFIEGSQSPFHEVGRGDTTPTCPSLLDLDGDGSLELVLGSTSGGFDYFRQVNRSFQRVPGVENPFRNVLARVDSNASKQVPSTPACAAFADLDGDGDLDMVVSSSFGFSYYEQESNGSFQLMPENPFAAVKLKELSPLGHSVSLVDWNGNGSHDLVLAGNSGISYWTRPTCPPSNYCKQGSCNPTTGKCMCPTGVEGPLCTTCSKSFFGLSAECQKCPGHGTTRGTCQRRGMCRESTVPGSPGPVCRCMSPFSGFQCDQGSCPQGQFLHSDADLFLRSEWYPQWEACMPCAPGRFKENSGNEKCRDCDPGRFQLALGQTECNLCPEGRAALSGQATCEACPPGRLAGLGSASCATCPTGRVVGANQTECSRCPGGTSPLNGTECVACDPGYVAEAGSGFCTPCAAGLVPNVNRSTCITCDPGKYAAERAENCSFCPIGSVPDALGGLCITCDGQLYAMPGDTECQVCRFPFMVMGQDGICSPLDPFLFLLGCVLTSILSCMLCGWVQLRCLTTQLRGLEALHNYEDLHRVKASYFKYGLWQSRAERLIAESKVQLDAKSRRLGISLSFVLEELRGLYIQQAYAVDWRWLDGELTHAGFLVKVQERADVENGACAWESLELCPAPENPNFYQLASLLTYGPSAVGKHRICPRDGLPDCSVVDALRKDEKSAPANWFLSWAWGYCLNAVCAALNRWWDTYSVVAGSQQGSIYLWWCFFVNNQFRMLQDGQTEDTDHLLEVFAKPLETAGKVLMCMDKFQDCAYTKRIWCIFEVFSAVRRSIPITLIMPGLDLNQIHQPIVTLEELKSACHVHAEEATASVKADEEKIKAHILKTMTSFEYVNQTVEQALWIEVIKMMKAGRNDAETSENVMNDDVTKTNTLDQDSETTDSPRAARRRQKL